MTDALHLGRVQRAIDATRVRSTARLRQRVDVRLLGRHHMAERTGVVDFANVRYEILDGDEREVVDRGDKYDLEPDGRWLGPGDGGSSLAPAQGGPHWLLDLLTGTFRAEPAPGERINGVDAQRFACTTDAVVADARTETGLRVPPDQVLRDLRAIRVDVWIGPDGLIRRLVTRLPAGSYAFDFWDFDAPPPVEPPPPELVDDPFARLGP